MAKAKAKARSDDDGDDDADEAPKKKKKPKPVPQTNPGADEAAEWLAARGLSTGGKIRWYVRIALDVVDAPAPATHDGKTATRFQLDVYRDEWGVQFLHKGKASHVRRVHSTFASGPDQHKLVKELPALAALGTFVRALETRHGVAFKREHALVRSNLAGAQATLAPWLAKL
jgi:hypothetical protein